jgi:hypothetical protein
MVDATVIHPPVVLHIDVMPTAVVVRYKLLGRLVSAAISRSRPALLIEMSIAVLDKLMLVPHPVDPIPKRDLSVPSWRVKDHAVRLMMWSKSG